MKTLDEYLDLNLNMTIIEDPDEGGFVVAFKDLPGCLTSGETLESAILNAIDAKREWLIVAIEDGLKIN